MGRVFKAHISHNQSFVGARTWECAPKKLQKARNKFQIYPKNQFQKIKKTKEPYRI
jgi:hypothetical protein